ncbi:MAG: LamG-like jellyroll fold domain-containing protein [Acinetobacter sp.]
MSKIDLTYTCDGDYDHFEFYLSDSPFTSSTLPPVYATSITALDFTINYPSFDPCYVMIASVKGGAKRYSELFKIELTRDFEPEMALSIKPFAFYKLNELSGDFLDSSGNGKTLIASSTVLRNQDSIDITRQKSSAALHTATDNWIGVYNGSTTLGTSLTAMCWINIPDSSVQTWGEFLKVGEPGVGFSVGLNSGGTVAPIQANSGRYLLIGQNSVSFRPTSYKFSNDAQKVHLAVRFTSAGVLTVFVNGIPVFNQTGIGVINTAKDKIIVGYGENISTGFKLPISRAAFFNAALSDSEILTCASISALQRL